MAEFVEWKHSDCYSVSCCSFATFLDISAALSMWRMQLRIFASGMLVWVISAITLIFAGRDACANWATFELGMLSPSNPSPCLA